MKGTAGVRFDLDSELENKHISMENIQYVSGKLRSFNSSDPMISYLVLKM